MGAKSRPAGITGVLRFFSPPAVSAAVGVALVVCSSAELIDGWKEVGDVRAAHGMVVLGVVHAPRSLGELGEAAQKVTRAAE